MLWKPLRGGTSRELFGLWVLSSMVSLFPPLCLRLLLPHHLHKWALDFSICSFPQRTQNQRPVDPKPLNPNQPIHKLSISNICYSSRKLTQKEQLLYRRHGGLESIYQESMNDHRNEQFCYWIFLNLKNSVLKCKMNVDEREITAQKIKTSLAMQHKGRAGRHEGHLGSECTQGHRNRGGRRGSSQKFTG